MQSASVPCSAWNELLKHRNRQHTHLQDAPTVYDLQGAPTVMVFDHQTWALTPSHHMLKGPANLQCKRM
eukprot:1155043-Pelagomonas_calceolata.AAC.2